MHCSDCAVPGTLFYGPCHWRWAKCSFSKWRGSFVGFVEFPSPSHICKKKFPMIQGWFVFVCVSVCVCVSVPSKKCCNFWTVGRIGAKFSGPTNLLASNFWVGDLDPAALGVRPVSAKSISSGGLGAGGSCKMLGAEFWNSAHGPRKRGQKAGLAWGPTKIWEFWHFFIKGTPAKIAHWSLSVWCNFLIQRNSRAPQVPHGPGGGGAQWSFSWKIVRLPNSMMLNCK